MKQFSTLTRSQFQYKTHPDGELIIYPADGKGNLQNKSAIAITNYTINLVKHAISERKEMVMGASRDNPPKDSIGALIKQEKQSPQQLSYLIPILVNEGVCQVKKEKRSYVVHALS